MGSCSLRVRRARPSFSAAARPLLATALVFAALPCCNEFAGAELPAVPSPRAAPSHATRSPASPLAAPSPAAPHERLEGTRLGAPNEPPAGPSLLAPSDFVYLGAFKLPVPDLFVTNQTFGYSNTPLAYYPDGDPRSPDDGFPGSLFVAGNVYASQVAELSIPVPLISAKKDPAALPTAKFLQPFTAVLAPVTPRAGFIMGMVWLPAQPGEAHGHVWFNVSNDYQDVNAPAPALGRFEPDLKNANAAGGWFVSGASVWNTGRYVMEIPAAWANVHTPGMTLATGRHRNSWGSAEGPNLFAAAPWKDGDPPPSGTKLAAVKPLAIYGGPGDTSHQAREFAGSDAYRGAAWLTVGDRSAVALSAIKDVSPATAYYGYEGHALPADCEGRGDCKGQRGWRCGDGRASLLLFDPADYADVADKKKGPWTPHWYARVDFNDFLFHPIRPEFLSTGVEAETLNLAYDRAHGLLYVSESYAYGEALPIVHVLRIEPKS